MTSIVALFVLLVLAWIAVAKRADTSRLLILSLAAYIFFWAVVPLGYVSLRPEHTGFPLADQSYLRIARLHLLSLSAALLLFAALPARRWRRLTQWGEYQPSSRSLYVVVMLAAIAMAIGEAWSLSLTGWGFLANVQFAVRAGSAEMGRKALVDAILSALVGFAIVCAVRDWSGSHYGRRILVISWSMLLAHAAFSITQGARAAVLLPLFVFLGRSWLVGRGNGLWRQWRTLIALTVACSVLGPILVIVGLTRDLDRTSMSSSAISRVFATTFGSRDLQEQLLLVADAFYAKFEHFRTGVTLLAREGEERAKWTPLVSAAYSPIPRAILPDKPVPLSRDGEATGIPWRIAASSMGDVMSGAVVPVAPAAVALWEFGWLGIVLLIAVNVYHLIFLNSLLSCRSLIHQALGVTLLGIPTTEFLFTGAAYLLRDDLRVLLYLVILNCLITVLIFARRYIPIRRDRPAPA